MDKRERYEQLQSIVQYLTEISTEEWLADRLAAKILRCFPDNPLGTLRAFASKGWSPSDIFHWLMHNLSFRKVDPHWTDAFYHIFYIEDMMIEAGLNRSTAHSLALTQAWLFWIPPVRLETAITTLLDMGYDQDVIKSIANQMPHLFHLPKEQLIDECKRASRARKGLLWNSKLELAEIMTVPTDQQTTTPWAKTIQQIKIVIQTEKPQIAKQRQIKPAVIPKAYDLRPRPLKTFKPESKQLVDTEATNDDKACINEVSPVSEESVEDTAPALDLKRFQALIESTLSDSETAVWSDYLEQNPWLKDKNSAEHQACLTLLRWAPIPIQAIPYHLAAKGDPGKIVRFWQQILTVPKAKAVLLIAPQTLEIRMYALRRVGRNFLKEPEWLLLEWEALNEVELRYRINEIEARGKRADLKPYVKMLLSPDRTQFLKRLDDFVERVRRRNELYLDDLWDDKDDERLIFEDEPTKQKPITPNELRAKLLAR
jgi:hypothetical protein